MSRAARDGDRAGGERGVLRSPDLARVQAEVARARQLVEPLPDPIPLDLIVADDGQGPLWFRSPVNAIPQRLRSSPTTGGRRAGT